jgi:hypothetical protein
LYPVQTFPPSSPVEFQLYYQSDEPWNYLDDYSYTYSEEDSLDAGLNIVVRDTSGRVVSGIEPDSAAIERMGLSLCEVYSRERSDWDAEGGNTVSQPSLTLVNAGSAMLENAHLYYFFTTLREPQLRVYWMEQMDKATVTLDTLELGQYAVHVFYRGINLHPGDRVDHIEFELNNADWSMWNYEDDPSFTGSDSLSINHGVLVLDENANRLWGIQPSEYYDSTDVTPALSLSAKEESMYPDLSSPRVRIKNTGTVTLQSFRIYYYFTTENGNIPVCDAWDAPGCAVSIEDLGAGQYRIVYECVDANIEPGDYFPNIYGSVVGLHYTDWSSWDRLNDYSAQGLVNAWSESQNIVVEDLSGSVLWGAHP